VPQGRITAYNSFGFEYARRLRAARSEEQRIGAYLWAGRVFCSKVLARGFGAADSVFGFNTAVLEILQSAKQRGLQTVMEQTIAPSGIEADLLDAERAAFPDWAEQDQPSPLRREVADREASEWDLADVILCGSGFVREGVRGCGGPADRCVVVPYGVSLSPLTERREPHQPLRVLVVGAVGLRKGSPYVVEAARRLGGATEFRLVGPVGASASALRDLPENVKVTDSVPRATMARHYSWADVFLLPSICEGSATATYEALGWGLPVICTPNTGSVVRDGTDGFIVPVHDVRAIVERIQALCADVGLWQRMSESAEMRASEFTVERYAERLLAVLSIAGGGSYH
jgi:glycosyltransferase involved in cell wall biosynthesis